MIVNQVKDTIKKFNLLAKNESVVAGVSGGPDSLALLYLLNTLKNDLKLKLYVAHLDHMLRPDSSHDAEFVKKQGEKLGLPVILGKVDLKKSAKKGSGEEIARLARFNFLFKVAKEKKCNKIALGHNLDDQAETVIMRILRGSGLYGLSGILPLRSFSGLIVIRPLIETPRKEIEAYLKKNKIIPRRDSTNLEDIYLRNRVRNNLLPVLRSYNKNITGVLANMAESIGFDYDYLNLAALKAIRNPGNALSLVKLSRLHPAVRRVGLRLSIAKLSGDTRRLTFKHIEEIEDLISNRPLGSIVDLPKGISAQKTKTRLVFFKRTK